jgi:hypothetical protein
MKAKLSFDLPEDEHEFYCANKGKDMFVVLWNLQQELRKLYKYEELNEDEWQIVERLQDFLNNSLNENEINLNK